jgi:MYXO-CTERM domain-containing protein
LAVSREIRFELFGRSFRVTDPLREDLPEIPAETSPVPDATSPPSVGEGVVVGPLRKTEGAEDTGAGGGAGDERGSGPESTRVTDGGYVGCAIASPKRDSAWALLLLIAAITLRGRRRQSAA